MSILTRTRRSSDATVTMGVPGKSSSGSGVTSRWQSLVTGPTKRSCARVFLLAPCLLIKCHDGHERTSLSSRVLGDGPAGCLHHPGRPPSRGNFSRGDPGTDVHHDHHGNVEA